MDIRRLAPAAPSQCSPSVYFCCEFFSCPQAWFQVTGGQEPGPVCRRGAGSLRPLHGIIQAEPAHSVAFSSDSQSTQTVHRVTL